MPSNVKISLENPSDGSEGRKPLKDFEEKPQIENARNRDYKRLRSYLLRVALGRLLPQEYL